MQSVIFVAGVAFAARQAFFCLDKHQKSLRTLCVGLNADLIGELL